MEIPMTVHGGVQEECITRGERRMRGGMAMPIEASRQTYQLNYSSLQ